MTGHSCRQPDSAYQQTDPIKPKHGEELTQPKDLAQKNVSFGEPDAVFDSLLQNVMRFIDFHSASDTNELPGLNQ
ncbi:MAG: hypothetical protein AAGA96_03985 [Verrucomicrobiota bacterium]